MVETRNKPETQATAPRSSTRSGSARPRPKGTPITTDRILTLVEGLGLVDLVTNQLRSRIEQINLDDVFDDVGRYVRRYPEVLVVALATVTVSSALIVYLNRNDDFDYDDDDVAPVRASSRPRPRR